MNTLNSKTNESNRFVYQFTDKLYLKNPNKNIALANLSIYYTWKNIKSKYNNNKFKIHAPTWNDEFNLPDGSYSIEKIQDYFKYIIEKHEKEETMQLLGSSKKVIDKNKDGEIVPRLELLKLS